MPIDPEVMKKLKVSSEHAEHKVWGEIKPSEKNWDTWY